MRKLNNKGFTLIELLAVLVILVVIMSIAIPSITSSVERSKAKQREQVINIVKAQAELYADKNKNKLSEDPNGYIIEISELVSKGFLTKEEAKDPMNEKCTIDVAFVYKNNSISVTTPNAGYRMPIVDGTDCS